MRNRFLISTALGCALAWAAASTASAQTCTNPMTGEQDVLVRCFADPCTVNTCDGDPTAMCEADYCGGCHAIFTDGDGNPAQCEPVACTKDAMLCPDGSVVGRDPANNCEFFPCPDFCINPMTGEPDHLVQCFADPCTVNTCEADPGATCEANYCGGCHALFTDADGNPAQCEPVACTDDAMLCPDGSSVGRDPANNCEFFPCPDFCINPMTGEPDHLVQCFVDPCTVPTCEADPDAMCEANYCGGCHAIYTDGDGNAVDCSDVCEGDDASGDSDGDGICDDIDRCADTRDGAVVGDDGCSGWQYVEAECGVPADHGRGGRGYIACVRRASREARRAGLLDRRQRAAVMRHAAVEMLRHRLRRWFR